LLKLVRGNGGRRRGRRREEGRKEKRRKRGGKRKEKEKKERQKELRTERSSETRKTWQDIQPKTRDGLRRRSSLTHRRKSSLSKMKIQLFLCAGKGIKTSTLE